MCHIRYFQSQVFVPDQELSRTEAKRRGHYLACYYPEGRSLAHPDYAEVIRRTETGTQIQRVIYYDRPLPHTDLLRQHMDTYPNLRAEVVLPQVTEGDETIDTVYLYSQKGELRYTEESYLLANSCVEIRKDPIGNVIGSIEYEYDENGDLMVSRERNADGTVISEYVWL